MLFGGANTLDTWEEVLTGDIDPAGSGLFGIAVARDWRLGARLTLGLEAQLVRHTGRQTHWEVNLPLVLRRRFEGGPVAGLGFALGLSQASALPPIELAREGRTRRERAYWAIEAAFRTGREDREVVLRLHHRSSAWGAFGEGGSTNSVVLGLRQSF